MNGKEILIVEDETIVALDMKMRLESLGYGVIGVVDTGLSALAFLERSRPDLVLMDIKLKGAMDGIETARKARERVEIPIIFVTAFTDEATLERAKHASPYGYIVKPFHERELRIAIELALYKFQYELSMRRQVELAEEANRVKGEFLANVSHELKTPLNSVIGFTELALDRAVDGEQRDYLVTVVRSARSLAGLIDSILDFSRLERNCLGPVYSAFSLDALLGECLDFLAVGAAAKGLDASFRRDPALPDRLVSDRARLSQVLMNLADNAVKFTERGRVRLEACLEAAGSLGTVASPEGVRGLPADAEPLVLRLAVEDTGIGMPQEKIAKAFESFTQLDGSPTRAVGGTGLGLAIVAKSVELLGGTVKVESATAAGSRFEVRIPAWAEPRKGARTSLSGLSFAVSGFSEEAREDIAESVAAMGGHVAPEPAPGIFVVADERDPDGWIGKAASRGAPVIIARRPGSRAASLHEGQGCVTVPWPVRPESLASAAAALSGRTGQDPARATVEAGSAMAKEAPASAAEGLAAALEAALEGSREGPDLEAAERAAKDCREAALAKSDETTERLAFQALLLARKGDLKGLAELASKARIASAGGLVHNAGGGRSDAIPGR